MKDLKGFTELSKEMPAEKEMVILIADSIIFNTGSTYQTDPYCGWLNRDGTFARWPHPFEPTHFKRIWGD